MRRVAFFLVLLACQGCKVPPPPDPNDPSQVSIQQPRVMMRQLKWASEAANRRVLLREITEAQAKQLVSEDAKTLVSSIPIDKIPPESAWEYAEVFRTARDWKDAAKVFEIALKKPPTEDRRVNDTLRLAHCRAEMGEVPEAIKLARSVFDAGPTDTAPVLPAILYEIVPAARGKGHDGELSKLLLDAVDVFQKTQVDQATEAGRNFVLARPHHIGKALDLAEQLAPHV